MRPPLSYSSSRHRQKYTSSPFPLLPPNQNISASTHISSHSWLGCCCRGEFPFQGLLLLLPSHSPNPITRGRRLTATTTVKRHFPPPKKNRRRYTKCRRKGIQHKKKEPLFFALPSSPRSVIFRHFLLLYLYTRWNEYKERRQLCKVASAPTFTQGRV